MKFARSAIAVCLLDFASVDAERVESGEDMPLMQFAHHMSELTREEERQSWVTNYFWGPAAAAEVAEVKKEVKEELGVVVNATQAVVEQAEAKTQAEVEVAEMAAKFQIDLAKHELAAQTETIRGSPGFKRAEEQVEALNASLTEGLEHAKKKGQEEVEAAKELAAEKLRVAEKVAAEKLAEAEENLQDASVAKLLAAEKDAAKQLTGKNAEVLEEEVQKYAKKKGADAAAAIKESVAEVTEVTKAAVANVTEDVHAAEAKVQGKVRSVKHEIKGEVHAAEEEMQAAAKGHAKMAVPMYIVKKGLQKVEQKASAEVKEHVKNFMIRHGIAAAERMVTDKVKNYVGDDVVTSFEAVGAAQENLVDTELEAVKVVSKAALHSEASQWVQAEVEAALVAVGADLALAAAKAQAQAAALLKATNLELVEGSSFSEEELDALLKMVEMYPAEMGLSLSSDFQLLRSEGVSGLGKVSASTQQIMLEFRELIVREKDPLEPRVKTEIEEIRAAAASSSEKLRDRCAKMSQELNVVLRRLMGLLGIKGDAANGALTEEDVRVLTALLSTKTRRFPTMWHTKHLQNVNITLGSE